MTQNLEESPIFHQQITAEHIQDWLAEQIATQLGIDVDQINITASFHYYGLDSVQMMNIANLGKEFFGLQLSPLVIWNYPNIESLSQYLAAELAAAKLELFEI
ncbi:MAG TPA: acyl carrier protein [Nostocaceae cyanobacterium]|nr:acyl carrier protein [Nostocaceae cyanobacterium]